MMHTKHFAAVRHTGLALSFLLSVAGCAERADSVDPCPDCGPSVAPPPPEGLGLTDAPELDVTWSGDAPSPSASLGASSIRVRAGGETALDVRVDRGAFEGEVAVWAEGLPADLVAEPAVIPDSSSTGRLRIGADEDATLGGPFAFRVLISADGVEPVEVPARVVVAGAAGSLDESFGEDGIAAFGREGLGINAVGVDTKGRVIVAGRDFVEGRPFIERLAADGALDPSYGASALEMAPDRRLSSFGSDIVMVGDEARLVMYAWSEGEGRQRLGLVALGATGRANGAIGRGGFVPLGWVDDESPVSVAMTQGDGSTFVRVGRQLIAVRPTQTVPLSLPEGAHRFSAMGYHDYTLTFGLHDSESGDRLLERVHVLGGVDGRFGDRGVLRVHDTRTFDESATHDVRVLSDGSGYAATKRWLDGSASAELVRFDGDGELTETFGDQGRVRLRDGERIQAMVLDAGERPVLFTEQRPSHARALVRYADDGSVDGTFGDGGSVDLGTLGLHGSRRVGHDEATDRIVVCGNTTDDWFCARFWL